MLMFVNVGAFSHILGSLLSSLLRARRRSLCVTRQKKGKERRPTFLRGGGRLRVGCECSLSSENYLCITGLPNIFWKAKGPLTQASFVVQFTEFLSR